MAWFEMNGASIDLALGSGQRETIIVGDKRRMYDGSVRQIVRSEKFGADFTTTPMVRDEADALDKFLRGHGENFRFPTAGEYYSSKGLAHTATVGAPVAGGASGKFDKRLTLPSAASVTWTPTGKNALTGDFTIACWWLSDDAPSDVWTHILVRKSGSSYTYYTDGVLADTDDGTPDGTPVWDGKLTVTAGVLKLLGEVTADTVDDAFSDLWALPFAVPTSWIASFAASTIAFPNRPHVNASGDLLNLSAASALECCASDVVFTPIPFVDSTGEALDGGRVSFRLEEV